MTLLPGKIIGGRFKIIHKLGAGNFAKTYLAEDFQQTNKQCAVKHFSFVSNEPDTLAKAQELFQREANVLRKLNQAKNKHIPQFIAYFQEDQEIYLAQEFIDGRTLKHELQQKKAQQLEEWRVIQLLEDILNVLKVIHNQGIIHRDIKPENLMYRQENSCLVLIDFGAVKEQIPQITQLPLQNSETKIYTAGYTPPEQYQGKVEFNSDIYALGMTALEALTGVKAQALKNTQTNQINWPSQIKVNDSLQKILEKMVDEDFNQERYQSVDNVIQDLADSQKTILVARAASNTSKPTHYPSASNTSNPTHYPAASNTSNPTHYPTASNTSNPTHNNNSWKAGLIQLSVFLIFVPVVIAITLPIAFFVGRMILTPQVQSKPPESFEKQISKPKSTPVQSPVKTTVSSTTKAKKATPQPEVSPSQSNLNDSSQKSNSKKVQTPLKSNSSTPTKVKTIPTTIKNTQKSDNHSVFQPIPSSVEPTTKSTTKPTSVESGNIQKTSNSTPVFLPPPSK